MKLELDFTTGSTYIKKNYDINIQKTNGGRYDGGDQKDKIVGADRGPAL